MNQNSEMHENEFVLTLPLYTYLIEPGPKPGYLRGGKSGPTFVPFWTDYDLFETYLNGSGLSGKVSGLTIHSEQELITFLNSIPDTIKHVAVDPNPTPPVRLNVWAISDWLTQFQ